MTEFSDFVTILNSMTGDECDDTVRYVLQRYQDCHSERLKSCNTTTQKQAKKQTKTQSKSIPSQGTVVWVRNFSSCDWCKQLFVAKVGEIFVCSNATQTNVSSWQQMTMETPYTIEYTLSAQEALIAIGYGKKVCMESSLNDYFVYVPGFGITLNGKHQHTLPQNCKYAIVED